jgi:hypothetical protein
MESSAHVTSILNPGRDGALDSPTTNGCGSMPELLKTTKLPGFDAITPAENESTRLDSTAVAGYDVEFMRSTATAPGDCVHVGVGVRVGV